MVQVEGAEVVSLGGNGCRRGDTYARKEVAHPTRTVTSTVTVSGGLRERVSVKTSTDVPKDKVLDVMNVINHTLAVAPVRMGDIVVEDVCGTGVALVATASVTPA